MKTIKNISLILLLTICLFADNKRPISMQPFDVESAGNLYNRGSYLIVLPSNSLESYLINENYGGDFVKFKKTQGFDVDIIYYDEVATTAAGLKEEIMNYYQNNQMLEYLLLVGDVNGPYAIPTFTIDSYNEEDIDVTDYPFTFCGKCYVDGEELNEDSVCDEEIDCIDAGGDYDEQVYDPYFFVGRWPIRSVTDFLNIKSRSIQYVVMDYASSSTLDDALLVAGNYKTADGVDVPPTSWPVTPVWTSLWLYDKLDEYGYAQIDTAFFHANNWETAEFNPVIENTWNDGVGVINYRGWGDANGWHKPYFHRDEVTALNNGWNLPVVLSFVCNTGDFGNDYSGTGLDKCFGEVLVTAGSISNPKGAAAMVGPSDLDTDTRFNNVICGIMWDALIEGTASELAPALHFGKKALTYEFSGLSAPDGTVIDEFYHHVYGVLGDPSISTWLLEPGNLSADISGVLNESFISTSISDENGDAVVGVVGALLNHQDELIGKGVSDDSGLLLIDFDSGSYGETFNLYLNKAQFHQREISVVYNQDNGSAMDNYSIDLAVDFNFTNNEIYLTPNGTLTPYIEFVNHGQYDIGEVNITISSDNLNLSISPNNFNFNLGSFESYDEQEIEIFCIDTCEVGMSVVLNIDMSADNYTISSNQLEIIVSSYHESYLTNDPSPPSEYGYWAFDSYDVGYDQSPDYNWIEINNIGQNLNLEDDTIIDNVPIGFDFNYHGNTYSSLTVCSNGWTSFEPCQIDYFWNFSIPNPLGPSGMLAPFMDDLDDNNGTEPFNVYSYNDGNGRFIIQWDDVSNGEDDENCPNCIKETFQMILHDPAVYSTDTGDGEIIFQYKEIHDIDQNGNYSTIGIESPDQNDGIQYLFSQNLGLGSTWVENDEGIVENLAIKFTTTSPYSGSSSGCNLMDVNLDGFINVVDIVNTVNIIFNVISPTIEQECAADANEDGTINVVDIVTIVNFIFSDL